MVGRVKRSARFAAWPVAVFAVTLFLSVLLPSRLTVAADAPAATPAEKPCPVAADAAWTPAERWAWGEICSGRSAEFSRFADGITGEQPVLRPAFLRTILLQEEYRRQIAQLGLRIRHARFRDAVSLDGIPLPGTIELTDSRFDADVSLNAAKVDGDLILSRSSFAGSLDLSGIRVGNNLYLNAVTTTAAADRTVAGQPPRVLVWGAVVGGNAYLDESAFAGPVQMDGLRVGSGLNISSAGFADRVSLANAHIGGRVLIAGTDFAGCLDMHNVRIGAALAVTATADGRLSTFSEVDLSRASVATDVDVDGARFSAPLTLSGAEVGGFIRLGGHPGDATSRPLAVCRAILAGVRVGGALVIGDVGFRGTCEPSTCATAARAGAAPAPTAAAASAASTVAQDAEPGGRHCAAWPEPVAGGRQQGSAPTPALNLQDASVGALVQLDPAPDGPVAERGQRLAAVWPALVNLQGLTYQRLRQGFADVDGAWLIDWIARNPRFSPQPYQQIAKVLRENGELAKADEVLFAARECERLNTPSWFDRGWKWLIRMLIGYGFYVQHSLFAALALLGLGTVVHFFGASGSRRTVEQSLLFSFDMLLPFVQLRWEKNDGLALRPLARWYFYAHRIAGFILGSFLIAGLSGLARS